MRKECDKVEHYVVFDFETTGFSPQKMKLFKLVLSNMTNRTKKLRALIS